MVTSAQRTPDGADDAALPPASPPPAARVRSGLRLVYRPREPAAPHPHDRLVSVRRPRDLVGRPGRLGAGGAGAAAVLCGRTEPRRPRRRNRDPMTTRPTATGPQIS